MERRPGKNAYLMLVFILMGVIASVSFLLGHLQELWKIHLKTCCNMQFANIWGVGFKAEEVPLKESVEVLRNLMWLPAESWSGIVSLAVVLLLLVTLGFVVGMQMHKRIQRLEKALATLTSSSGAEAS